ncbi:MAG: MFS transporter [Burkholderiaceae bacterium]|nr:MFS transporter [Burkholderiaceae bacterium]
MTRGVPTWGILLPAAMIVMVTMGTRNVTGLFVSPMNTSTGIGIAGISFALAVAQFVWGVSQPIFGALADRYGSVAVMIFGSVLLALGFALTPLMGSELGLVFTIGLLSAAGAGAGSFSILFALAARNLPPEKRSFGAGFINAGSSFGQFVFAPLAERLIAWFGWMNAMLTLAVLSLGSIPMIWRLGRRATEGARTPAAAAAADSAPMPAVTERGLREQLAIAMRDRSYLLIHLGFFTCGFHVAFLLTHLPGEIAVCGLPTTVSGVSIAVIGLANIVGSLGAGALGNHYRMKYLLFWTYLARAVIVLAFLAAPKVALTFYLFAAGLGLTFLATVAPTAGLVGKLFGVRHLATLFGLTLVSHQVGGFLGAWLGGIAFERTGGYQWMWIADVVLATMAAIVHLPIREAPLRAATAPA